MYDRVSEQLEGSGLSLETEYVLVYADLSSVNSSGIYRCLLPVVQEVGLL